MRVHVIASTDNLNQKETGLGLRKASAAAKHVHERAAVAELECHVDVVVVLETFIKTDDVRMRQRTMYLNFSVKLVGVNMGQNPVHLRTDGPWSSPSWS